MFVFPIGDENPTGKFPYINTSLIIINCVVFFMFAFTRSYQDIVANYGFIPAQATPYTYITSLFLHGSLLHLIGNMVYLYIAGDNVEDKLGHIGYLLFYISGGIIANFFHAHMVSTDALIIPTIGASGAISAILGAYVLLFPKNRIKFFYIILIIFILKWGVFYLTSLWAIGLWFILQIFSQATASGQYSPVAYGAHIGGFIGGIILTGILIITGILKPHWHRAQDVRDINGYGEYPGQYFRQEYHDDENFQRNSNEYHRPKEDDYW